MPSSAPVAHRGHRRWSRVSNRCQAAILSLVPGNRGVTGQRDQIVAQLEAFGLTRNEARIYLALLRTPRATAAELGDLSGVPRAKVYGVLRGLVAKGFALPLSGQVARFQAVAAELALQGWLAQREHQREFASDADQHLAAALSEVLPTPQPSDGAEPAPAYVEAVSGQARIAETSEQLLSSAQTRILMVQQPPYFQPPSRWNKLEIAAIRRGVDVRVIYSREAVDDERRYRPLLEAGAELRVLDTAPMKLLTSDGTEALVALRDPLTGEQGVTSASIHHPDLVAALELMFEQEWRLAERLDSRAT
jgi:HTH-type transcriptional regulator, sugar sensing transcriptional regulator